MSESQRVRLLAAAVQVVSEVGYQGMSSALVSGRAGVSRKTFYELFVDREDCFLAVFEDTLTRVTALARPGFEGEDRWRERLRCGLSSVLEFIEDEPLLGALMIVDALAAGPKVLQRRMHYLHALGRIVDEGRGAAKRGREPPALTAEGVVGGVLSVLHARLLEHGEEPFLELLNPLMAIVVLPYLGPAAAEKELERPLPRARHTRSRGERSPLVDLQMRITHRTLCVLAVIAEHPGASNREVAGLAGISDQGQMSKLLARLQNLGLLANDGAGQPKGEANAWTLTPKGQAIQQAIQGQPTEH
jgi:AcrR family transcriptional regulator